MLQREQRESDLNPNGESSGDPYQCQTCKMSLLAIGAAAKLPQAKAAIQNYAVVQICNVIAVNNTICPGLAANFGS